MLQPDRRSATATLSPWSRRETAALAGILLIGIVIRLVLMPAEGLRDDTDQFVGWVHHIVASGLGALYEPNPAGPVTFGPVMGYVWAGLATVDAGLRAATDASDPAIRTVMKAPAVLADVGLALLVAYALRNRPTWAVVGAAGIMLHPAVIDVSAWWGQYESVYALTALAAAILAINGRNGWAAAAITVALITKPQVLPLLVPFAAWFWATGGWRGIARAAVVGAGVAVVLWLPFVAAGGPAAYLSNLGEYQGNIFAVASLRAWNLWWLLQVAVAGGAFVSDDTLVLGPLTLRQGGFLIAGLLGIVITLTVLRRPTPRTLVLALAASVLVSFSFLTQMHERYAFGAVVFLLLMLDERPMRWLSLAFGTVFTINLLSAVPPTPEIGSLLSVTGVSGVVGSVLMLAITIAVLGTLALRSRRDAIRGEG